MTTTRFYVTQEPHLLHIALQGDMQLMFENLVSSDFVISLYTLTTEMFVLTSNRFHFQQLDGTLSHTFTFGGRRGLFVDIMFDTEGQYWHITANNIVNNIVVSSSPPSNSDGQPDGTIYIQTS
jgi:hypothetical protein